MNAVSPQLTHPAAGTAAAAGADEVRGAAANSNEAKVDDGKTSDAVAEPRGVLQAWFALIFVTVDIESSSRAAYVLTTLFKIAIVLSIVAGIVSSEPSMQVVPATCPLPACDHDPVLCPGTQVCAPVTSPVFVMIDAVCVWIFTVEYGLKMLSVWAVSPNVAGMVPLDATEVVNWGAISHTVRFFFRFRNLVDLGAIVPYYASLFITVSSSTVIVTKVRVSLHLDSQHRRCNEPPHHRPFPPHSPSFQCLRLLRLIRILRLMSLLRKFEKLNLMLGLMIETLRNAWPVLGLFAFLAMLLLILVGNIIFIVEQGTFTVTPEYPDGVYMRSTVDQMRTEVSPYDR
jgi:Ion transport protein